jgi:phage protein U
MPATVMMKLGPITFELPKATYDELTRKSEYRWAVVERLGSRPARQWMGIGDDQLTLAGVLLPLFSIGDSYYTGTQCVEEMRAAAEQGIPYDLTDGLGKYWGKWCIESVDEVATTFMEKGVPRRQAWSLKLGRYANETQLMSGVLYISNTPQLPRMGATSALTTGIPTNQSAAANASVPEVPPISNELFQGFLNQDLLGQ